MTQDFSHCRMEYRKDEQGKEVLLKDGKFQVMMEWEKPYMHACIDALKPFGDVLEIGFGLAYSAERIQSYKPKSHTIIEFHPEVAAKAREWAKKYPNVNIVEDTWQNALSKLGVFDCIFFDDYPLQSEEEMQKMENESTQSSLLLQQGEKVIQDVEKAIPFLKEIKYSDDDLKGLMLEIPLDDRDLALQFARFLTELSSREQISKAQLQNAFETLVREKKLMPEDLSALLKEEKKEPFSFSRTGDRLFQFLSDCLKFHMRKGSRFSCFLSSPVSKFEDEKFFNEVITNPLLDFHEEEIVLDVPQNCGYFTGNKALVITIVKMV
ncbi:MAG: class I SAM-dependent methyltransferase [Verrucomicrobia bacterium]|nr:class I SAM-dependent methyltransferase [Verrucomicrobiota bacterium]